MSCLCGPSRPPLQDGALQFHRGAEPYIRPCGWKRVALRVVNKYQGGDSWLGTGGQAWPVSYHGYQMDGSVLLTHTGDPEEQPGFLDAAAGAVNAGGTRGRGVYSTPLISIAEKYCKTFTSKVDGKTYKVVLQNRINPEKRRRCQRDDLWLVYIPQGSSDAQTRAIVQESVRPYGLLLKPL